MFSPMMIAAYITWLGVGISLFDGTRSNALVPESVVLLSLMILHFSFLFALIARFALASTSSWHLVFIGWQSLVVLLMCSIGRNGVIPVLSIIVVTQWFEVLSLRRAIIVAVIMNAVLWWVFSSIWLQANSIVGMLAYIGFQAFAAITARALRESESNRSQLTLINAELLATRHLLEASARDQERLRLARELHDVAGHKLTALKLNLAASTSDNIESVKDKVKLCEQLAHELLQDIRSVVAHLRAHDGMDLRSAINSIAMSLPRPQLEIQLNDDAKPDNARQAETIIRAVQEALTNSARHTDAKNLYVELRRSNNQLRLTMQDNGNLSRPIELGNGLKGMRERFEMLSGECVIESAEQGGLRIRAWIPLNP